MSVYTPAGLRLYSEAVRVVPGLIAAKERKAPEDASTLFEGFMQMAQKEGIPSNQAWSIMFNASIHWVHQLAKVHAEAKDTEVTDVIQHMAAVAAVWEPQ